MVHAILPPFEFLDAVDAAELWKPKAFAEGLTPSTSHCFAAEFSFVCCCVLASSTRPLATVLALHLEVELRSIPCAVLRLVF